MLLSGLATLIGLIRVGIQTFWASEGVVPRVLALEIGMTLAVGLFVTLIALAVLLPILQMNKGIMP